MKIYFAGSIRGGRQDASLYSEIIEMLGEYGEVQTEHIGLKSLTDQGESIPNEEIYKRDIAWLESSELVVAEVTSPSLGVGYELCYAENMKIPVLCLHRPKVNRLSGIIGGCSHFEVAEYEDNTDLVRLFKQYFSK